MTWTICRPEDRVEERLPSVPRPILCLPSQMANFIQRQPVSKPASAARTIKLEQNKEDLRGACARVTFLEGSMFLHTEVEGGKTREERG